MQWKILICKVPVKNFLWDLTETIFMNIEKNLLQFTMTIKVSVDDIEDNVLKNIMQDKQK